MDREVPDARATLAHVLTHTADGIFVVDSGYRCVLFSPGCERMTGFSAGEVLGVECRPCEPAKGKGEPSPFATWCPELRTWPPGVDILHQQIRLRRKDGSVVWVEGQYLVLRDQRGGVCGVLGVLRTQRMMELTDAQPHPLSENPPANDLPELIRGEPLELDAAAQALDQPLDVVLASVERRAILTALRRTEGRRSQAAREMGISRSRLYRRMEALGIHPREDL
ncbi:MAG: helix-turn-helix domain-containing protein [Planctomycetota bacterium]